jgi:hypothetical protein
MQRARILALVVASTLIACQDQQPAAPKIPDGPLFEISDGHVGGNPGFFFLAPIRRFSDDATVPATGFNADLSPVIEVYECSGTSLTGCVLPLGALKSRLTKTSGNALLNRVFVLPRFHEYAALWDTRSLGLRTDRTYRIQVSVGGQILGFADVDVVRTIREAVRVDRDDFVPLLQNFILPIRFWIGNNALCTGVCSAKSVTLSNGGTVELAAAGEVFKLDIAAGTAATSGGTPVTDVTFNLSVCDGIDVDLPKRGKCLRVTTFFDAAGVTTSLLLLNSPALISMCSITAAEGQEGLVTLHQQDGDLIRALPHAHPNCTTPIPAPGLGVRGWRWLRDFAGHLVAPRTLYAGSRTTLLHLGGGGEPTTFGAACPPPPSSAPGMALATCTPPAVAPLLLIPFPTIGHTISDFQFALPAQMAPLPGTGGQSAAPGNPVAIPPGVRVTDAAGGFVANATVHFQVTTGNGTVTPLTVTSDAQGIAQVTSWVLGNAGTNTVRASGVGIAGPDDGGPFMPDISLPPPSDPRCSPIVRCQAAVIVREGAVIFTATARLATGALSFVQQPTAQIANLRTLQVVVRALDEAGAVLPGVSITLGDGPRNSALGCGMGGVHSSALTDETGRATFSLIDVSSACDAATLLATGSKAGFAAMSVESQSFAIADIGGSGTATIDGVVGSEEWATARCLNFDAAIPEGGTTPAMLCAMNDASNVYFLVRFSRGPDPRSSVDFQFDQNRSGGINSGDDLIVFQNPLFTFEDDHWFDNAVSDTCPVSSICSRSDVSAGGTTDGAGGYGNNGGETIMEVSHPLAAGDAHDISVAAGQTIDFFLGLNIYHQASSIEFGRTFFRQGLLKLLVK